MNLRPLTMQDADFMLKLKNYPETRQFAIASHEEIDKESHYKWLEKNLQYFQIIIIDGKDSGAIRIQDYEISVWVDKEFWKQGIATFVLQHIAKRGMTSKIVEGNIASMKCFTRAGFEPIEYVTSNNFFDITNYYIFKKY